MVVATSSGSSKNLARSCQSFGAGSPSQYKTCLGEDAAHLHDERRFLVGSS